MNPTHVSLEAIADWDNLASAAWRASAGKRGRYEVRSFLANLLPNLSELRRDILDGTVCIGQGRAFWIRDPKPRLITAACFRERVLQHALMWHVGPLLERALVADTFACLTGRGTGAAVRRTQEHVRRFPWYAKMAVRANQFTGIAAAHRRDARDDCRCRRSQLDRRVCSATVPV